MKKILSFIKKTILTILILVLITPTAFFAIPPQRANAQWLTHDLINDIWQGLQIAGQYISQAYEAISSAVGALLEKKELILDGIARAAAQAMIRKITVSTVEWINNGFEGKPGFLSNPQGLFMQTLNEEIGRFIHSSDLGWLCNSFALDIRVSLSKSSLHYTPDSCTLTDVVANIEDAGKQSYKNVQKALTNPQENYVGSWLEADNQLTIKMLGRNNKENTVMSFGSGFMSWSSCDEYEAPKCIDEVNAVNSVAAEGEDSAWAQRERARAENNADQQTEAAGGCTNYAPKECKPGRETIKTPGSVIQGQMNEVLGSDMKSLEVADEINEILVALAGQMIKMVMSSAGGLLGAGDTSKGASYASNLGADLEKQQAEALAKSNENYQNLAKAIEDEIRNKAKNEAGQGMSGINIAQGKETSQSSGPQSGTGSDTAMSSGKAIDGMKGTYSSTNSEINPWWQVDLGKMYNLNKINIWKRTDVSPDVSLGNFKIIIMDSNGVVTWTSPDMVASATGNQAVSSTLDSQQLVSGQIVRIQRTDSTIQSLQLSEVEVYGVEK